MCCASFLIQVVIIQGAHYTPVDTELRRALTIVNINVLRMLHCSPAGYNAIPSFLQILCKLTDTKPTGIAAFCPDSTTFEGLHQSLEKLWRLALEYFLRLGHGLRHLNLHSAMYSYYSGSNRHRICKRTLQTSLLSNPDAHDQDTA